METITAVKDLRPDDLALINGFEVPVIGVDVVLPDPFAGSQHDDDLHGSGRSFLRVRYTNRHGADTYKDFAFDAPISAYRYAQDEL